VRTPDEMKKFLEADLRDALKGVFVGAVVWDAADEEKGRAELCPFQRGIAMSASFVQARALYEFYSSKEGKKPKKEEEEDDARASDFLTPGTRKDFKISLFSKYMVPVNKRLFHLVYGRSGHAGGPEHDEKKHIKSQVLAFAKDLRVLTEEFGDRVKGDFRDSVQFALREALKGAQEAADRCGIVNPI